MKRYETSFESHATLDRRSFIKLSGLLGLGAASAWMVPSAAEAVRFDRKRFKVSSTRPAMGTLVSMTLIHGSSDEAQEVMGLAFGEMDRLARILNRYDQTTAVGLLNMDGRLPDAPPEVRAVVSRALHYHQVTGGAFDITVKPVIDLFKETYGTSGNILDISEDRLQRAVDLVDARSIVIQAGEIRLARPGMGLTLDGIAKGYIVDLVSDFLSRRGVENHLVNAGGDIRTRGKRDDGRPWAVAVEDPEKKGNYPAVLRMGDGAVATSGNYEIYFDREKMVHHIVNPASGLSPQRSASVSVKAETAMDADALATGIFVMEPDRGIQLANSLTACEALVIERDGRLWPSRGWKTAPAR